jgi:hypothetical protein
MDTKKKRELHIIAVDGSITIIAQEKETLTQLQNLVGGYIERVRIKYLGKVRDAYANEEGILNGMPINFLATKLYQETYESKEIGIVGPLVVVMPNGVKK